MKNYENLLQNEDELKSWVFNFINVYDHYLVNLTPNLKEKTSFKLFNMPYKELKQLVEATKSYKYSLDQLPVNVQGSMDELNNIRSIISRHVERLNKGVNHFNEITSMENPAEA